MNGSDTKNRSRQEYVLGVLGGMGTYATIHLFQQYAEVFPAEKEWDRPRIIIDNNCTMPSRVRAVLYNEGREELVKRMTQSMFNLISGGVSQIILACNTSHLFLDDVYKKLPEARKFVINIIDECVREIKNSNLESVYLLATEGTIISGVYSKKLEQAGISCHYPQENEFSRLRFCIEAVKQNEYNDEVKKYFMEFVNRGEACVLGCTELPVLYELYKPEVKKVVGEKPILDPLYIALGQARNSYLEYIT